MPAWLPSGYCHVLLPSTQWPAPQQAHLADPGLPVREGGPGSSRAALQLCDRPGGGGGGGNSWIAERSLVGLDLAAPALLAALPASVPGPSWRPSGN
jgi:hypothetical protein